MIRPVHRVCTLLLPLALLAAGCGDPPTSPSPTEPTTPPPVLVSETFQGSLSSGATNFHVFHTLSGVFSVTLTSTDQPSNPALGMSFGMWDGKTCTDVLQTLSAVPTMALPGTAALETDVCIRMWDPTPWEAGLKLSYALTVVHFAKAS